MYKQCSTNRTISRQRELEGEILKIISHRHFEKLSVVDLCEHLNIPRKAFYRYFSSKEGALYAIIDHALTDALENFFQLQESAASAEQILRDFFRYWKSQRGLLDVLAYNDLSGLLLQRAINISFGSSEISRKIFPLAMIMRGTISQYSLFLESYLLLFSGTMEASTELLNSWQRLQYALYIIRNSH